MFEFIFNKDVWNKVIAGLILAAIIGAITYWFPMIKEKVKKVLLCAIGIYQKTKFTEPIIWKMDRFLFLEFNNKGMVHRIRKFGINGVNITSSPIKKMDGYIEVDRTGERFPIKLHRDGNIVEVDELLALPPDEQIGISVFFSNTIKDYSAWKGFEPSEFIDRYAPFTFITIFSGRHYKHSFPIKKIQEYIDMRVSSVKQTEKGPIFRDKFSEQ